MLGSHKKGRRGAMRKLLSLVSSPEKHNLCGYPTQLSLSVLLLFLRTKAISSRMTLQENGGGGYLLSIQLPHPCPHTLDQNLWSWDSHTLYQAPVSEKVTFLCTR